MKKEQYKLDQITEVEKPAPTEQALIPFSIEKWESGMYDVEYRCGIKVVEVAKRPVSNIEILSVGVNMEGYTHNRHGEIWDNSPHNYDLMLRPKERKVYRAVYNDGSTSGRIFNTQKECDELTSLYTE